MGMGPSVVSHRSNVDESGFQFFNRLFSRLFNDLFFCNRIDFFC
jgi:hypothetical protein